MSQQLLDVKEARPAPDGHAREPVAQVVSAEVLDPLALAGFLERFRQVEEVALPRPLTGGEDILARSGSAELARPAASGAKAAGRPRDDGGHGG